MSFWGLFFKTDHSSTIRSYNMQYLSSVSSFMHPVALYHPCTQGTQNPIIHQHFLVRHGWLNYLLGIQNAFGVSSECTRMSLESSYWNSVRLGTPIPSISLLKNNWLSSYTLPLLACQSGTLERGFSIPMRLFLGECCFHRLDSFISFI